MAWTDNLLDATFDGIPFFYEEASTEVGRRVELHEFPGSDTPYAEDIGKHADLFTIKGFLVGENYASIRDDLQNAIRTGGDHQLVHPYKGEYTVKVLGRVRFVERTDRGRYVEFEMQCCESGIAFEAIQLDTVAKVVVIAEEVLEGLGDKTKMSVLGAIGAVLTSIANGIGAAASAIRKVNGKISAALNLIDNIANAINDLEDQINTLLNTPNALMSKLTSVMLACSNLIKNFVPDDPPTDTVAEIISPAKVALDSLRELFSFETVASVVTLPTAQGVIEADAHRIATKTVRAATLATFGPVLVSSELDSSSQALSIGSEVAELFEALEVNEEDFDETVIQGLASLKAAMVEHFTRQAAQLPVVISYTPPQTVNALWIANELYGDAERAEEIVLRNNISHPCFVMGGNALEVLADG